MKAFTPILAGIAWVAAFAAALPEQTRHEVARRGDYPEEDYHREKYPDRRYRDRDYPDEDIEVETLEDQRYDNDGYPKRGGSYEETYSEEYLMNVYVNHHYSGTREIRLVLDRPGRNERRARLTCVVEWNGDRPDSNWENCYVNNRKSEYQARLVDYHSLNRFNVVIKHQYGGQRGRGRKTYVSGPVTLDSELNCLNPRQQRYRMICRTAELTRSGKGQFGDLRPIRVELDEDY